VQLFDLENDLGEQRDISKEKPEITQKLLKMLQDWRKETDAKMPQRKIADSKPVSITTLEDIP
jgi:arylsulfatase A